MYNENEEDEYSGLELYTGLRAGKSIAERKHQIRTFVEQNRRTRVNIRSGQLAPRSIKYRRQLIKDRQIDINQLVDFNVRKRNSIVNQLLEDNESDMFYHEIVPGPRPGAPFGSIVGSIEQSPPLPSSLGLGMNNLWLLGGLIVAVIGFFWFRRRNRWNR